MLNNRESLFAKQGYIPLAERCRPATLEEYVGQGHIVGDGRIIDKIIKHKQPISLLLWGGPGCGKTTLARLIASYCGLESYFLSAIAAGVADVRKVIEKGRNNRLMGRNTLLFIDEIHRFNKAQQDAVLGAVENGDIVLIGATTENPSFQVISPLLSRTRVLKLSRLSDEAMKKIVERALNQDQWLKERNIVFEADSLNELIGFAAGDARRLLNLIEVSALISENGAITQEIIAEAVRDQGIYYDRGGDRHYDTISALIKSIRGSDPNAAVYYLTRMLAGGEDPEFIARRLIISASEDVGNASPQALSLAVATLTAVQQIGLPEASINLAQCVTFLASSPKSNASYIALKTVQSNVDDLNEEIPLYLRNAPTELMKNEGYSKGYKYPHDYPNHFVVEKYLPEKLQNNVYYHPSDQGSEKAISERLRQLWPKKYK